MSHQRQRNPVLITMILCSLAALSPCSSYAQALYDNLDVAGGVPISPDPGDSLAAQQFLTGDFESVASVTIQLSKSGSPSGIIPFEIWDDNGSGVPGSLVASLGSIDIASLSRAPQPVTMAGRVTSLNKNTRYFVVWDVSEANFESNQIYFWMLESDAGTNGAAKGLVAIPVWTPVSDLLGADSSYWQMSVNAIQPGDFNGDGLLTATDIDLLTTEVIAGTNNGAFDVNADGAVNASDRAVWVNDLRKTYFGDSNLDGEFNSSDFVAVFQIGEYEDAVSRNSTWTDGDWNGDQEFTSGDFVAAFQEGGYEKGPPPVIATVPEPTPWYMFLLGFVTWFRRKCLVQPR
jgi:hypothetical protein